METGKSPSAKSMKFVQQIVVSTNHYTFEKKTGMYNCRYTLVRVCIRVCISKTHSLNKNSSIRLSQKIVV